MATVDRMFYTWLDLPVQWWILYRGYGIAVISVSAVSTKLHLYQALILKVCSKVQKHRPTWSPTWIHWRLSIWGVRDRYFMYAGGFMSPMQMCFSDLVCQPLVTSYVIDAYLCLAMLHAWTLEYQHMMLCVWWWIPTKAERPAGEDRRVALATSGSKTFRRMPTLYCYLRCGDLRSPWVTERRNGHSDYATTMMVMMMMMMKDELCQNGDKLIFQVSYRLSRTGIVECLKIIDVGCNPKQFDVQADRKCMFSFSAVNENADENEIPFSAEKRKQMSPVPISHNLVTVQLRT